MSLLICLHSGNNNRSSFMSLFICHHVNLFLSEVFCSLYRVHSG
jgi:hypothetical protein